MTQFVDDRLLRWNNLNLREASAKTRLRRCVVCIVKFQSHRRHAPDTKLVGKFCSVTGTSISMNIAYLSPHNALGNKGKRTKVPRRFLNKSGPVITTSFKEVALNLHAALQTRLKLSCLCGFCTGW